MDERDTAIPGLPHQLLSSVLSMPGFTLFYYDQRVRKEGYDIERMMQAAGMSQSTAVLEAPAPVEEVALSDTGSGHE